MKSHICLKCIGNDDLRNRLQSSSRKVTCTYCGRTRRGLSIEEVAENVDDIVRQTLRQGEAVPRFGPDDDSPSYEQEGDELSLYVGELLGIDDAPAEAVVDALIERDPADIREGDEPFYDRDQLYCSAEVIEWEYLEAWHRFENTLKHEERFFGRQTAEQLERILGAAGSAEAAELPVVSLDPDTTSGRMVRARVAASEAQTTEYIKQAARELSAPPPETATPGRMNPAGIAVFYAAFTEEVAISEVRPLVGDTLVLGAFHPARPLRLLDLTQLVGVRFSGSVFHPHYFDRAARAQFLHGFHSMIARPVSSSREPLEYLPTQAVAEYVRNTLLFDGIVYASTQVGALDNDFAEDLSNDAPYDHCNVVVFGHLRIEYQDEPWSMSVANRNTEFPLQYEEGSAHAVRVSSVTYKVHNVDYYDDLAYPTNDVDIDF